MNLKRFTARTSREALAMVKAAFGDDAVVMSTKPCDEGVEVLAMAPESVEQLERMGQAAENFSAPAPQAAPRMAAQPAPRAPSLRERAASQAPKRAMDRFISRPNQHTSERTEPEMDPAVEEDVEQLQMSTLSFQDYVRQRMIKRQNAEQAAEQATGRGAASRFDGRNRRCRRLCLRHLRLRPSKRHAHAARPAAKRRSCVTKRLLSPRAHSRRGWATRHQASRSK